MARSTPRPPEIAGFRYVKLLGSGGFSDVFLYQQAFPERLVAVKVLLTDELTPEARTAFTAEANVMAQLSAHPYIVTILQAAVTSDDRPYLVMEYCSGLSLADRYKREPLAVAEVLRTGIRLSSAIATAHAAGILHRDIKPANVLTNSFGWPALTDFGIASTVEEEALHLTATSRVAAGSGATGGGTASVGLSIPWSPPEMFDDDPTPDVRSDVFSLSATLYTLLEGHTPFELPGKSNGSIDLISRISRGSVTPFARADLSRALRAVLQKGLSPDPADRFATATAFGRALQGVETSLGYNTTALDVPEDDHDRPVRAQAGEAASVDETRARPVATIAAQGPGAPRGVAPASSRPAAAAAAETIARTPRVVAAQGTSPGAASTSPTTVVRPRRTVVSPTGSASPATPVEETGPASPAPEPTRSRRRLVILLASVAVIVVIGALVAVAAVGGHASPTPVAQKSAAVQPQSAVDNATTPDPVDATAALATGGKSVLFTWKNPQPKAGDTYGWTETAGPGDSTEHSVSTPSARVDGYASGTKVCVSVVIVRNGSASANPLTECYP